ncbi:UNVERIFIED_CONTAM: hypothetical protein K2H54_051788 [Gekko kuhli]
MVAGGLAGEGRGGGQICLASLLSLLQVPRGWRKKRRWGDMPGFPALSSPGAPWLEKEDEVGRHAWLPCSIFSRCPVAGERRGGGETCLASLLYLLQVPRGWRKKMRWGDMPGFPALSSPGAPWLEKEEVVGRHTWLPCSIFSRCPMAGERGGGGETYLASLLYLLQVPRGWRKKRRWGDMPGFPALSSPGAPWLEKEEEVGRHAWLPCSIFSRCPVAGERRGGAPWLEKEEEVGRHAWLPCSIFSRCPVATGHLEKISLGS